MHVAVDPATGGLVLARIGDDWGHVGDVYVMQTAPGSSNTAVSAPAVEITGGGKWLWAQSYADGLGVTAIPREPD